MKNYFNSLTAKLQNITKTNLALLDSKETKFLKKQIDITSGNELGICCLTSIFNAYPNLFDYDEQKILDVITILDENKYKQIEHVLEYFNSKYRFNTGEIFRTVTLRTGEQKDNLIVSNINDSKPVVFYIYFRNKQVLQGHAITILGYDEKDYYAFENARDNPILHDIALTKALAMIRNVLKPENDIQKDILLRIGKAIQANNAKDKMANLISLHSQIIADDTIFSNHNQFFKFDRKFLYDWYDVQNIGLVLLNDKIDKCTLHYSFKQYLGQSGMSTIDYLCKFSDKIGDILARDYERYTKELHIDMSKEDFIELWYDNM